MLIEEHKSLKSYNTFGIDCSARFFVAITSIKQLQELVGNPPFKPLFFLGGGSNMLLTGPVNATVVHVDIRGISVISETDSKIHLRVSAGENWHEFVSYCLDHNYGGIENLSLIPGNVGAAPIQNIGAYGVELKDVLLRCRVLDLKRNEIREFSNEDCQFGYRNSVFKNDLKGEVVIVDVDFELTKKQHRIQTDYGAIQQQLEANNIADPTIQDVSRAVIAIRQSKLPDPNKLGNSGSFFKNPVINADAFQKFRSENPSAPFYEVSVTEFKIPAGWLIEQCGFKGKRFGDAGVHSKQALVLVNYGNATGEEIWELAMNIQKTVKERFDIFIEPEVNII